MVQNWHWNTMGRSFWLNLVEVVHSNCLSGWNNVIYYYVSFCGIWDKRTCRTLQAFLDSRGFNFHNFLFNEVYNSILFSSPVVLPRNLDWCGFCFRIVLCVPTLTALIEEFLYRTLINQLLSYHYGAVRVFPILIFGQKSN